MTEASGKDSAGVPKGQMTVAQVLKNIDMRMYEDKKAYYAKAPNNRRHE
jgi:hypothetical protein